MSENDVREHDAHLEDIVDGFVGPLVCHDNLPGPSVWLYVAIGVARGPLAKYFPDRLDDVIDAVKYVVSTTCAAGCNGADEKVLDAIEKFSDFNVTDMTAVVKELHDTDAQYLRTGKLWP